MKRHIKINPIAISYNEKLLNLNLLDYKNRGNNLNNDCNYLVVEEEDDDLPYYILYLTDACNLNCEYCFNNQNNDKKNNIFPSDKVSELVDFFEYNSKEFSLRFFGGEPLLRKNLIKKIVNEINKRGLYCHYNIFTNGILLDEDMLLLCKKNNFTIFLSLPGSYDEYINLENKFNLSLIIKKIIDKKINIIGRIVWIPNKNVSLKELIFYGFNNGIKIISFTLPWGEQYSNINKEIFNSDLDDVVTDYLKNIKINNFNYIGILPLSSYIKTWITGEYNLDLCGIGKNLVSISTEGDLYPCHCMTNDKTFYSGNIFDKIWIKKYENFYTYDLEECKNCDFKLFCKNKCLGNNYLTNGNPVEISESRCYFEKKIIASSAYILDEIKSDLITYKRFKYIIKKGFNKHEYSN